MRWVYYMDMMKQKAVRIAEQIHREAKIQATQLGITLRAYVEGALRERLKRGVFDEMYRESREALTQEMPE